MTNTIETVQSRQYRRAVLAKGGFPKTFANRTQAEKAAGQLAALGVRGWVTARWPFLVIVEQDGGEVAHA